MPTTTYEVVGNPTAAQEQQSDEIFSSGDLEAINTVAANIDNVNAVAENGESWATRAEQGAVDAENAASNILAQIIIVGLAGGSSGSKTGIGAAWTALGLPAPSNDTLAYAHYADLVCVLMNRASAGVDASWGIVGLLAGAAGSGGVTEPADDGKKYVRKFGTWEEALHALAQLSDVDLATVPPVLGDGLVFDGTKWVPGAVASSGGIPEAPGDGAVYGRMGPDGAGVGAPAQWIGVSPVSHNHNLAGLLDFDNTTPPTNGQIIRFDTATNKWKPSNESTGAPALNDLTDVNTTGVAEGMTLVRRGAEYVMEAPAGATGKQAINPSKLVGPTTHDVVAGDTINQLSVDLSAGDVTLRWDNNLTHGASERLQGQVLIEATGGGSLKFASVVGSALIAPDDPPLFNDYSAHSRNSTTSTIAAGDLANTQKNPSPITIPAGDDIVLLAIGWATIPAALTYDGIDIPRVKVDSVYYDRLGSAFVGAVKPVASSEATNQSVLAFAYCIPLGDLASPTDFTVTENIIGSMYNGIQVAWIAVSGVDQASPWEGFNGSPYESGGSTVVSFAPSVTTLGINRMAIQFAAKAGNTGTSSVGDGWSATGATKIVETTVGNTGTANTGPTGIVAYEMAPSVGTYTATLAHTVAAKNACRGAFALKPTLGAGAPNIQLFNAADVSDLGRMIGWQYDKNAGKCWIIR